MIIDDHGDAGPEGQRADATAVPPPQLTAWVVSLITMKLFGEINQRLVVVRTMPVRTRAANGDCDGQNEGQDERQRSRRHFVLRVSAHVYQHVVQCVSSRLAWPSLSVFFCAGSCGRSQSVKKMRASSPDGDRHSS